MGAYCLLFAIDPGYEGMAFYTSALDNRCDVPPVDIGYHYPGVVRFVDASKDDGDQTGLGWDSAYQYLQDALDEAQTVNYQKMGSDPFNSPRIRLQEVLKFIHIQNMFLPIRIVEYEEQPTVVVRYMAAIVITILTLRLMVEVTIKILKIDLLSRLSWVFTA